MTKTITALIIKFLITLGAAWIAFTMFGNGSFTFILTLSIVGTIINYLIGDLLILPNWGNIIASIGDGGLSIATAYALAYIFYGTRANTTATAFIIFGIIIAVAEYFFHIYLLRTEEVSPNPKTQGNNINQSSYNMEMGEEFDLDIDNDEKF